MKLDTDVKPRRSNHDARSCVRLPEHERRRVLDFPASCEAWRQHEATTLLAFVARALVRSAS